MAWYSESVSLTVNFLLAIMIVQTTWIVNGTLITVLPWASLLSTCRRCSSVSAQGSCHSWRNILVPIVSRHILGSRVQEFCGIKSSLLFCRTVRRSRLISWLLWCRRFCLCLGSCQPLLLLDFPLLFSLLLKSCLRLWLEYMLFVEHSMAELNLEYSFRKISFNPLLNYWHLQNLIEIGS